MALDKSLNLFALLVLYAKSWIFKRINNRKCLTVTHAQVKVALVSTLSYLKIWREKEKKDPKASRTQGGGRKTGQPEEEGKEAPSVWGLGPTIAFVEVPPLRQLTSLPSRVTQVSSLYGHPCPPKLFPFSIHTIWYNHAYGRISHAKIVYIPLNQY